MKKFLTILALLIVVIAGALFLFGDEVKQFAIDQVTKDMYVMQDDDSFDPGPAVGTKFPDITASWRGQPVNSLDQFAGENGTAFLATRSADWCPFCMKQMIQLQQYKAAFY